VTATAGGGEKVRIRKTTINQPNLLGGTDKVRKSTVTQAAFSRGPAPGSRSSRRIAGIARRANQDQFVRARKIRARVSTIEDRRAAKPGNYFTKRARDARSLSTKGKALKFLESAANKAASSGGIMSAIQKSRRYTTVSNPDPSRRRKPATTAARPR
jgi:hypothetical protein